MLEVDKVCVQFGGLKAVQDVSLRVSESEIVGLIGPNGAGKTTLFNLITCIYRTTGGSIRLGSMDLKNRCPNEVTNVGKAARTFQNIRLFRELSVLDNVLVASHLKVDYGFFDEVLRSERFRRNEEKLYKEAYELLKIFKLDHKADELARNLPYGDQRRLEIVRALATGPKILFLDEPAAGMNNQETAELLTLVRFVRDQFKVGILVIEHDMKFIMGLCERIYVLDHGQLIAMGNPQEVKNDPKVVRAYLGEETVA